MQPHCSQAKVGSAAGFEPLETAGSKAQLLRSKRQLAGLKTLDRSAGFELIWATMDLHAKVCSSMPSSEAHWQRSARTETQSLRNFEMEIENVRQAK